MLYVLHTFVSRDIGLLTRAHIVYVRPLLENNSVTRSPYTLQDIEAVERVQRRFTKRLSGLNKLSYQERLRYNVPYLGLPLGLPSLELRRLQTDLIWCYKIVFGLVDLQFDDFFKTEFQHSNTLDVTGINWPKTY